MIRSSLEETGNYRVFLAGDEPSALVQLKSEQCALALLDVDLGTEAVVEIGRGLRSLKPDLKLIIVSDEDIPVELDGLRPWVLLRKPFYLPELFRLLASLNLTPPLPPVPPRVEASAPAKPAESRETGQVISDFAELPWLKDVNKAAQRLTRLTLESSAQAALITRGKTLWAYAGQFSQDTANELVRIVTRNWDEQKGGDLLRFARLDTTRAEHMLYATALAEGTILAMAFDAETPFSTIRSQANSLARSLSVEKTGPIAPYTAPQAPSESAQPPPPFESDDKYPSIADIISDIPTPIPRPLPPEPIAPVMRIDLPVETAAPPEKKNADPTTMETRVSPPLAETHVMSRESSPPVRLRDLALGEMDATVKHEVGELDVTAPSNVKRAAERPSTPVRRPQPGELDETKPHSITEVAGRVILESTSAGLYQLNYACLLVPRFSSHYLTGDLAGHLSEWIPTICVAFGWRLEYLSVRPEYMQWVVSVPPNTSPGYLMRIMRQQTSEKAFAEFPRLKRENPSGDFWAPGYLIMGGTQPHPSQLVKDYIKQTRDRQGISEPRK
jgi:REP element-mobilizing transposase RayT/DNA-binding response OmpR family regulator